MKIKGENGVENSRCYSLCGDIKEKHISIAVKKVPNGIVSNYLCDDLLIGDILDVSKADGNFTIEKTNGFEKENCVFISAGSGITPIKSMIENLVSKHYKGNIYLIYGNNNESEIIFKTFLETIQRENKNIKIIQTLKETSLVWDGEQGRLISANINKLFENYNLPIENTNFYISGPQGIIENSISFLESKNVPINFIFSEKFHSSLPANFNQNKPIESIVIFNEKTQKINYISNLSLLEASLSNGINIPHSCKSGTCLNCIATLKSGEVLTLNNSQLTEDQIKNNIVLTCQTYAKSNALVIDFDAEIKKTFLKNRNVLIGIGASIGFVLLLFFFWPKNEEYMAKGEFNTGHQDLQCVHCHKDAPGTARQQIQRNLQYFIGADVSKVDFGTSDVGNEACLSCHARPNDNHPVYRFLEPKFKDARQEIHPEKCVSCHAEHKHERVTFKKTDYCINCHKDIKIEDDPLDIKHSQLIKNELWNTCIQCHDFHGNHEMKVATKLNDTIPLEKINAYFEGKEDPYSKVKKYVADLDSINNIIK